MRNQHEHDSTPPKAVEDIPDRLDDLADKVLADARQAAGEIEYTSPAIADISKVDDLKELVAAGDIEAINQARSIIESPESEHYAKSFEASATRELAYRDLAIAAYEGGFVEQGNELGAMVRNKMSRTPLLLARAKVEKSAIPEILPELKSAHPQHEAMYQNLATECIREGDFEHAGMICDHLHETGRKFQSRLEMVRAGDENSVIPAREAAINLLHRVGERATDVKVYALTSLFREGDDEAIRMATEIAISQEKPEDRLRLLSVVGSALKR